MNEKKMQASWEQNTISLLFYDTLSPAFTLIFGHTERLQVEIKEQPRHEILVVRGGTILHLDVINHSAFLGGLPCDE
jgi:hypothetical protein